MTELARLKRHNKRLVEACRQAIRRIEKLNEGGPDLPDPTLKKLKAALEANKAKS